MADTGLAASFERCWRGLAAQGECAELSARLLAAYAEPARKYHTLQHLRECLALLEEHYAFANDPAEVEFALWFHDAVYNPHANDNEQRSADWARDVMLNAQVDTRHVDRVAGHILATRHDAPAQDGDGALLVDIDLAILGAPRARFDEYEAQVRTEYGWVPDFIFRRKRREMLMAFAERPYIYRTPELRLRFEAQARANLRQSLQQLGADR